MESFNLEISAKMNISPSLTDQTNRNASELSPLNNQYQTDAVFKLPQQIEQSELISEQPTTPSKQSHNQFLASNKENHKIFLEEKMNTTMDEPMDIDTSQLMPQTPLNIRTVQQAQRLDSEEEQQPKAKPPISGAKIVKPIRPTGSPRVIKPYTPAVNDFNEDEFVHMDPFKSKPKIGFDGSISLNTTLTDKEEVNRELCSQSLNENCPSDEWETHRKRSNSNSRKSLTKLDDKTSQQETSPPTKQTSSIVSSNTDLSSVSSSPPPEQSNPLMVLSATSTSSFSSSNTNSTSSMNNKLDDCQFQTPKHQIYTNNIEINVIDEIKIDLNDDKLSKKFIEAITTRVTTNDVDNLIDFNKLNDLNEVNDDFDSKINETTDFKTEDNLNAVESVVFDSIFSNDNDLLETKEVSSVKISPKYSEFARKSLYLQFDPIAQLSKSLSPDKVKRLSLIVDKQEAIKTYLSGIAEEEDTTETEFKENHIESHIEITSDLCLNSNLGSDLLPSTQQNDLKMNQQQPQQVEVEEEDNNFELDPRFNGHDLTNNVEQEEQFDNRKTPISSPVRKQNNTILDLDQLQLSDSKLINNDLDSIKSRPNDQDSFLEDLQIFTKNAAKNRSSLTRSISVEEPERISPLITTITTNTDDAELIAKLLNENKALKERERANLAQMQSLEEENDKFKTVAIEFESIFRNLIKDKEESEAKLKNEIIELTKERGHLQEDVIGVERAFDDLHRRFEKLKTKVEEFKKNEENLQKAIETYKQQLDKEKNKYSTLKKHAEEKLEQANSEIDKLRKTTSIELQTLRAELRKAEIKISSLELSVQQKDQENTQLTNLLEDLLSKVKPNM